jgi:hypothetical protein
VQLPMKTSATLREVVMGTVQEESSKLSFLCGSVGASYFASKACLESFEWFDMA